MGKKIGVFLALALLSLLSNGQIATNFSSYDCIGNHHVLFDELDSGKVVVIVWVMPCGPCVLPAKTAYNIVQSYFADYPDKVLYYLCDDLGNNTCEALTAWAQTNNLSKSIVFSNSEINMYDYGGAGMPKIAIIAGEDHKIYNTQENSFDAQEILNAIDLAIQETSDVDEYNEDGFSFEITYDVYSGAYKLKVLNREPQSVVIELLNSSGKVIETILNNKFLYGETDFEISDGKHKAGFYLIRVTTNKTVISKKIIIV